VGNRIAVAIPGIVVAIAVVYIGGPIFLAAVLVIALAGIYEYLNLVAGIEPLRWAAYGAVAATVALPFVIDPAERGVALGVGLAIVLAAVSGLLVRDRQEITIRVALTVLGAVYIGVPLGLFVATREIDFGPAAGHGAAAVANILVGTWAFDTCSYFGGRMWGAHPIAPRTSPKKTVEGFLVGVVGGTLAVWVAGLYMDWIGHLQSLALGLIICAFAYVGDLFESLLKRDIGVKDSGRVLGAHGGILDRFDAILFTAMAGYFATVWLV
jgi:phosphatidate cytidylyltransferase